MMSHTRPNMTHYITPQYITISNSRVTSYDIANYNMARLFATMLEWKAIDKSLEAKTLPEI